ncbi:MalY/PatB family protein [Daejeonella lutea]|uniref:cysteine-S-conjugate beta-lyase n=1 Tax=Daejeonella lutea TaxID=572036 RepID=A0A1T5B5I7_9SPHI|nr:MalY/PatB family protein [Daejeonella lutea]SKB42337.1 cystathione beta-lyase [Daejeonella lutea]
MKYNFDEVQARRGTHSIKWDTADADEILPMWIADMDFRTFPPIVDALTRTTAQGHYGYNIVPSEYYEAIMLWWQKRHGYKIKKDSILPSTGVVAGISAIFSVLTKPGDEVIIQTPAYNHFYNVIKGAGCTPVENELFYEDGVYKVDFDDLETKARSGKAKILLLCNPHNPVGRAWNEHELQSIASICTRHDVYVVSDEIHSDLLAPGKQHVSFLSVTAAQHQAIVCSAASKTFNLSGLHAAYLFVDNEAIRKEIEVQLWAQGAAAPSLLACEALKVAYTKGDEWLNELNNYLHGNYQFLKEFISTNMNNIKVLTLEATYLVWLDCKQTGMKSKELADHLIKNENLWVNPGDMYGAAGEGFLRINIACPRQTLIDGLNRLKNIL